MGQAVSTVREEARKENEEAEKRAQDALNSLQDLAKTQLKLFLEQVKDDKDNSKIAIKKIINDTNTKQCGVTTDGKKIAADIKKSYHSFADGDIADGIGDILGIGLDALFGSSSTNSNEDDHYFITVGSLGYPLGIDMHMYTYMFTSETLIKVTKNVLVV